MIVWNKQFYFFPFFFFAAFIQPVPVQNTRNLVAIMMQKKKNFLYLNVSFFFLVPQTDGRVSLEEFVPIVNDMEQEERTKKQFTRNDYIEALNQMDRDGEGTIPSSLLRHMLSSMGV